MLTTGHEALEYTENVADIMDTEEQDQKIRMSARDALDKVSGKGKKMVGVSNKKELGQLDTLLPLNPSSDVWREALPVTKITDSMYPFDDGGKRPTVDELDHSYKVALGVLLNPVNKEYQKELEPYVIQMFGKTPERHEGLKQSVTLDKMPAQFNLHLKLLKGKNLIKRDANDKSDPYCFITIVKPEHVDMITSSKHDLVKINQKKRLGLNIEQSEVIPETLNPTWNEEFVFPLGKDPKSDMILIEVWDSDQDRARLKRPSIGNITRFLKDLTDDGDDYMGRALMSLSTVSLTPTEKALTLYSFDRKETYGEVTVQVQLVGIKPTVDEAKVLKDHSLLTATVLDFESHMTGEYPAGWNTKITPIGYKLLSLNAVMNGITPLQQASVLFPLLQLYDKHVNLSIIGFFGVVRTISLHQDQLPAGPNESHEFNTYSEWVQTLLKCMDKLGDHLVGVFSGHHQLFSFRTEEGIDYLALHVELIKEMYKIKPHVERLEGSRKTLKDSVHNACKRASKSWFDILVAEAIPLEPDVKKQLLCFLEVINHILQHLHNAIKVQAIFREIGVDYYSLLYVSVDQQVSVHIQDYTSHRITKGEIPTYQLYLQISDILKLAQHISPNDRPGLLLNGYHEWFKAFVSDWIDVAAGKSNDEISRAVTSFDKIVTVTENVKFSQSALSVAACFKRITTFWNNLHWPRVSEHYAFMVRVVEIISKAARFYIQESHKHLKSHNYFMVNFIVTQELCISLNDIEYVRGELSKTPETLRFDALISRLAAVEGDQHAVVARKTLLNLISSANDDVNFLLRQVASSVTKEMSGVVATHLHTIAKSDPSVDLLKAIDPLMQYLTKNMGTFYNSLLVPVLKIMIVKMWSITICGYTELINSKLKIKQEAAKRLLETLEQLESFFHAGGDGLSVEDMRSDEYKKVYEFLIVQATTDDELIDRHLTCLAEKTRSGDKDNGLLSFSVGYIQNKQTLEVMVIKAANLPALDTNGLSDPYVQIMLMPEKRFEIKAVETDYKSKDLNPTYYKDFKIAVEESLLDMSGSVLTLTVYDHDYLSKDDFAGMVVIEGKEIPRLLGDSIDDPNAPQRKTYELPLLPNTMTPALEQLAERNHIFVRQFKKRNRT